MDASSKPTGSDLPVVERIALNLARFSASPSSTENLEALRSDLQTHGLATLFEAASRHLSGNTAMPVDGAVATPMLSDNSASSAPAGATGSVRQTWTDCIGSRVSQPLKSFRPTTLDELRSVVTQAAAAGCRIKAVGSGHSFSDVAVTRDFLIDTHGLCAPLALERDLLGPDVSADTLFETQAGILVRDLNEALWTAGLGLVNMGGYDGQTIAGVISTSTHGSGLAFGPLSSQVESLTVVAGDGKGYRIEPTNGITDPTQWIAHHPDIELKQDDAWFNAGQVGLGCLGVVYSVILRVRERYWLKEERTLSTWSRARRDLLDGAVLQDNDHYELLINPYETNGDHTCIVTRRNPVPEPDVPEIAELHRNFFVELAASLPSANAVLQQVLNSFSGLTPTIIDKAMEALACNYVDRSYRVFNIGMANNVPAYGSEIAFTMNQYQAAVDRILEIASARQEVGNVYLVSPFALRFVKASTAYLSMMNGADTCMVEFPQLKDTFGGIELLQEIETEMYGFGGRPHWGLLNFLSGANGLIEAMYPMLPAWLDVFRQISPTGAFDNAFTERCGFSPRTYGRT